MNWRIILRPICWAKTRIIWPYPVKGHDYIEIPSDRPIGDGPLKCQRCGFIDGPALENYEVESL